ncbi:ABC transporter substrate-binding protein [Nocardioides sambongensis]|uniref:ABC transporter substrate-binding protein n=1 Tax=Nocardioides sambongensis TaxID=2589074 RepID=UPI00112C7D4F|nr:ABC transporter substrate-binding protein [Nocardioides sambongensis]
MTAALMVSALAFAGCANSSSEDGEGGTKDTSDGGLSKSEIYTTGIVGEDGGGDPVDGGVLTIADFGEPRSLDPTVTYANGATGGSAMAAIYDTLIRYDFESQEFVPQLAESLESDDNVTWTLKLRDGVEFTDGTPLDADAVLASIGYYQGKYAYNSLTMMSNVADTKKVDDLTIEFTMRNPWATFPNMLAGGAGMILAPAAYKDPENFKPIGAGPFTYGKYSPGEELTLDANQDYFDGAPHLDGLKFVWLGAVDDEPKLEALESGAADTAFIRDSEVIEDARDEDVSGMMFATGLGTNLWINNREGRPGEDVRVRQAINYAIDAEAYNTRVNDGSGLPTKSLFADSSPWATDVEPTPADTEKAKELLEEAKADGFDGKITYVHAADASSQAGAVALKAMLDAVGFEVTLDPLRSVADQVQRLYVEHDYDLAIGATTIPDEDPYTRLFGSMNSQSPTNSSGYANPKMDELLVELQAAASPEEGADTMAAIEELWNEDSPGIGMAAGGTFQPWNDNVHGMTPTTETMFLYDDVWKD